MAYDNASGQTTGVRRMYGLDLQRQKEITQYKRLRFLSVVWMLVGFFALLAGLFFLVQLVPTPIFIGIVVLWTVSGWAAHGQGLAMNRQTEIRVKHNWQDVIDQLFIKIRGGVAEALANSHETFEQVEMIISDVVDETHEQELLASGRRGRGKDTGRPETTREEWIHRGLTILEVEECHDRQQVSYEQACARADVVYSTFRDWRRKIPKDCLNEARARLTRN